MEGGRTGEPAAGPTKWQELAVRGVPTFLLLEDASGDGRRREPDPKDEMLGAWAEDFYAGLSPSDRLAWPGGAAKTLAELADRHFFSPAGSLTVPRPPDGALYRAFAEGRYVRAVNFHATPARLAGLFEEQLDQLAERFAPVSYGDLADFVITGEWPHERPGVMLNFFDGFRSNHEVAAPILDRLGLTGWFFLVSGWVSSPPEEQSAFASAHLLDLSHDERDLPDDGRLALSPGEVRDLARRGHVVASHTQAHTTASPEFDPDLSPGALAREVLGSKRDLERFAGGPVRVLAWREGTPLGADGRADGALRDAGYEILLANHAVQRIR